MQSKRKLPLYSIRIEEKNVKALNKDVSSDRPVPANLSISNSRIDKMKIMISYRGAHIRKLPKKSYQCTYVKPDMFSGEKEFHLNAEYIDHSFIRNKLSFHFFQMIGCLAPEANHILLEINDEFQGIYLRLESVDRYFLKQKGLPDGAIYYAENDDANFSLISPIDNDVKDSFDSGYSRKYGTKEDDEKLKQFIYKINTVPQAQFGKEIIKHVNVDKYLRWLAGVVCTQNFDGFIHNYALYYPRETGLFELIPWDYDATWGRDIHGRMLAYDYIPIEGYNTLTARILDVPAFRKQYKMLMRKILNHQFTLEQLMPVINMMYDQLRPYVDQDPYKGNYSGRFEKERHVISQYIKQRNRYLKQHLSELD